MTIKKVLFVFLVALIARISYVWFFVEVDDLTFEDQLMYIQLGKDMIEKGDFLQAISGNYIGFTDRLPGYPALLAAVYALFGESNMAVVVVQIFIDSLTCVIIGLIAESVITRGFIVAGIVSALNLNMIILSGMILTDTLFLFLFSIFILFAFRYLRYLEKTKLFLAISFLSLATLVRPVSYYLILLILLLLIGFLVWKTKSFKQVIYSLLLYVLPVVVAFGSIHYRNYSEYNSFSLVSQGGGHAMYWVVPATYQYSGQGSYQEGKIFAKNHIINAMKRDGIEVLPSNSFKDSNYHMKVAKEALLELGLLNVLHAWSAGALINFLSPSAAYAPVVRAMDHPSFYATPGNGTIEKLINYVFNTNSWFYLFIITIGTLSSIVFLIISIFGIYKMAVYKSTTMSHDRKILLFSLFIMLYFIAITGPIVGVKYRLPLEPIMVLFFSYAFIRYRSKLSIKKQE